MKDAARSRGTWVHRFAIRFFTLVLGVLIFWLLGFFVKDIPSIRGPDYTAIEAKHLDTGLVDKREALEKEIANRSDLVLVIGSENSSNSRRLAEVSQGKSVRAYLIEDATEFDPEWIRDAKAVGITAGASAPEDLVQDLVTAIRDVVPVDVSVLAGADENVHFRLPAELALAGE